MDFPLKDWMFTKINELTLEHAIEAAKDGFFTVCADGRPAAITDY